MIQISPAKENSHTQQPPQKAQTAFTLSQISLPKENCRTHPLISQQPPQKNQIGHASGHLMKRSRGFIDQSFSTVVKDIPILLVLQRQRLP